MMTNPYDELESDGDDELPARPRKDIAPADLALLQLAARAIGAEFEEVDGEGYGILHLADGSLTYGWNCLTFYSDAFCLAVDLGIQVHPVARTADGALCSAASDSSGRRLSKVLASEDIRLDTARAITVAAADIAVVLDQKPA